MKVLLMGDYPPPYGGVAIHVQQLHRGFTEAGIDVRVLDVGKGPKEKARGVIAARGMPEIAAMLARLSPDGRLFHLHTSGNNSKSFLLAAAASVGLPPSTPKVITIHSGLFPAFMLSSHGLRVLARAALARYTRVVAVSGDVWRALRALGVPERKLVMHPAFCASAVRPGPIWRELQIVLQRRSPLIVYAHHPSRVYGRALMFEALAVLVRHYPDLGLAVFGPGTEDEAFQADARQARVEGLIENLGELPHPQALAVMQRAQVFVRPTSVDGDAITVREAMALGVPCVASDASARPEGALLFKTGDAADLVEKVLQAIVQGAGPADGPDAVQFLPELYESVLEGRHFTPEREEVACGL